MRSPLVGALLGVLCLSACQETTSPPAPPGEIQLLLSVNPAELQMPAPPENGSRVAVGVFLGVPGSPAQGDGLSARASSRIRQLFQEANTILAQCRLYAEPEIAHMIVLPPHLSMVAGNRRGSWGGHPPAEVGDPDLFMYHQNERLTDETRELFGYGKRHTSRNAISIFVVPDIEYYIGEERAGAGGLSFPPTIYHHIDDYPLRNSVLVRQSALDEGNLPVASGRTLAHELAHMLLDTGDHVGEPGTLMLPGGTQLSTSQCERMHRNRVRLYGDQAVADPGPPGGD